MAPVQDGEEQLPGVFRPMHLVGLVDDQQIEGGEAGNDLLLTLSGGGVPGGANLGEDLLRGLQQGVLSGVCKNPAQGITQMRFAGARSTVEDRCQAAVAAQPVGQTADRGENLAPPCQIRPETVQTGFAVAFRRIGEVLRYEPLSPALWAILLGISMQGPVFRVSHRHPVASVRRAGQVLRVDVGDIHRIEPMPGEKTRQQCVARYVAATA